jgi:hypothetical protein
MELNQKERHKMNETEEKLLDEYCEANFNYELWSFPNRSDELKKSIYNTFAFKNYVLKYYWNEFLKELSECFPFNMINNSIKKILNNIILILNQK